MAVFIPIRLFPILHTESFSLVCSFAELLQSAEDFLVDIPKLWEYVAEIVEPMLAEGVIPLTFLGPMSSSLDPSLAANFVAAALGEVVKAQVSRSMISCLS